MSSESSRAAKVLIVEDEVLVAAMLEDALVNAGHSVVGLAADEAEALKLAEHDPPAAAIIDLQLARGSDGSRAALLLQKRFRTRIVMVSGYSSSVVDRACRLLQPFVALRKPFSAQEVENAVRRCLSAPG